MKNGYYWLDRLPEDIKKKFLSNLDLSYSSLLDENIIEEYLEREWTFSDFIVYSFSWAESPEGHVYWEKIINNPSEILILKREETINIFLNEEK